MKSEQQLKQIKNRVQSDEDKDVVNDWERRLKEIELDEKYLFLPQTQELKKFLLNTLDYIKRKIESMESVSLDEVGDLNELFIRRRIVRDFLSVFKMEEDLKDERSALEEEIDVGFNKL